MDVSEPTTSLVLQSWPPQVCSKHRALAAEASDKILTTHVLSLWSCHLALSSAVEKHWLAFPLCNGSPGHCIRVEPSKTCSWICFCCPGLPVLYSWWPVCFYDWIMSTVWTCCVACLSAGIGCEFCCCLWWTMLQPIVRSDFGGCLVSVGPVPGGRAVAGPCSIITFLKLYFFFNLRHRVP